MPDLQAATYERDQVVQIINSVIEKVQGAGEASRDSIFNELKELQKIIEDARAEVGQVRPSEINEKHIPAATDELEAVVQATAEATGTIMDVCEVIEQKAAEVGGDSGDAIANEVTKIYEACSFQDITGQRISKVVKSLTAIEEKIEKLLAALGGHISEEGSSEEKPVSYEESLLNGPQMPDKAISQDDIDKLLEQFD